MRIPPHGAHTLNQKVSDHEASIELLIDDLCVHDEAIERVGEAINALLQRTRVLGRNTDEIGKIALEALQIARDLQSELERKGKPWYSRIWGNK